MTGHAQGDGDDIANLAMAGNLIEGAGVGARVEVMQGSCDWGRPASSYAHRHGTRPGVDGATAQARPAQLRALFDAALGNFKGSACRGSVRSNTQRGARQLDYLVVQDRCWARQEHAHVFLRARPAQKDGTFTGAILARAPRLLRGTGEVTLMLSRALGHDMHTRPEIMDEVARLAPAFAACRTRCSTAAPVQRHRKRRRSDSCA
ncbi:hypothetical protein AAFM48_12475 [Burkholderia pseudomallei]